MVPTSKGGFSKQFKQQVGPEAERNKAILSLSIR